MGTQRQTLGHVLEWWDGPKPQKRTRLILDQIQETVYTLASYWPLTLRQVYYALVAALLIDNCLAQYKRVSRELVRARDMGLVPWGAIEDRVRTFTQWETWRAPSDFVDQRVSGFLKGYSRDYLQTQETRLEVWCEKDALATPLLKVASEYQIPVGISRGFSSASFTRDCHDRVVADGRFTRILFFADLDPSGAFLHECVEKRLHRQCDLEGRVEVVRYALTPEQVKEHQLPVDPDGVGKKSDPRKARFLKEYGSGCVELDALPPPLLEPMIREAIESQLDMDALAEEREAEADDFEQVQEIRERVEVLLREEGLLD